MAYRFPLSLQLTRRWTVPPLPIVTGADHAAGLCLPSIFVRPEDYAWKRKMSPKRTSRIPVVYI